MIILYGVVALALGCGFTLLVMLEPVARRAYWQGRADESDLVGLLTTGAIEPEEITQVVAQQVHSDTWDGVDRVGRLR